MQNTKLQQNIKIIQDELNSYKARLIAISKYVQPAIIRQAYELGLKEFGENKIQDAINKITHPELKELPIIWHFVGHLQTNKTKQAVEYFNWIHSVDSIKLLQKIITHSNELQRPLNILLQVKLADDPSKHGFEEQELITNIKTISHLIKSQNNEFVKLRGLMTILPIDASDEPQYATVLFKKLKTLQQNLQAIIATESQAMANDFTEASMGMSDDYRTALEHGATMIRIGSKIFSE